MTIPLVYDIEVTGDAQLKRVLRGIEAEVKASAGRADSAARSAGGGRRGAPDQEARQAARMFDQIGRAARAADAQLYRQRMSNERQVAREKERLERKSATDARRSQDAQFKNAVANAKAVNDARLMSRDRMGAGFATRVTGGVGRALGTIGQVAGLGLGIVGGASAASALDEEIHSRAAASQLANQGFAASKKNDPSLTLSGLKGQVLAESGNVKGFTRQEAIGGLEQFTNLTGDLDTARKILPELSKFALATNTNLGDLMATAGNAFIPINDGAGTASEKIAQLKDVVAALVGQGAVGAIEIKDLATQFAGLAASSNKFAGTRPDLMKKMGAIAQAARQRGGAESAAEAVTATAHFGADLTSASAQKRLAAIGVNVFSDKSHQQIKDPEEVMVDLLNKTKGNLTTIGGILGLRGVKAAQGFSPLWNEGEKAGKGGGEKAVRGEFKRLLDAQMSAGDAELRAKSRLADEDIRAKEALKEFNAVVGSRLIPAITELVPKFEEMIPKLADLASAATNLATSFLANPYEGIGVLIAGYIAADLASAGIGAAVTAGITKLMTAVAIPGILGAAGSAAGALGVGANAVAGAAGLGVAGAGVIGVGVAGGAAAAATAATLYQGYGLYKDVKGASKDGDSFFSGLMDLIKGPARVASGADYDRLVATVPGGKTADAPSAQLDASAAGKQLEDSAARSGEAIGNAVVAKLAAFQPPGGERRNAPLIAR